MKYYDVLWPNRERKGYPQTLTGYLSNRFGLKRCSSILDIGCGDGTFTDAFKDVGMIVEGIDYQITGYNAEKDKIPFGDNTFDVVFNKSFLDHILDPILLMNEIKRVLIPGGKLIILVPDWNNQREMYYEDFTRKKPYIKDGVDYMLKMFEFKNIQTEMFYHYPLFWDMPFLKTLRVPLPIKLARYLTKITGIKYFRWSCELNILGYGEK